MKNLPRLAAVLLLLAAVPAGAQVGDGERVYSFFSLRSTADGAEAQFVIEGFLPIEEFVGLSSVTSEANLGALRASSLAALPDPGELVLTLPGTLSALAGVSGLPDYPAAASADHPSQPEDEIVLVPDAGLGAGRLRAAAAADSASASAAIGDFRDTVGLLPGFSIGSIKTTAETLRSRPGALEAVATSVVADVRVAGGLLRIAEIASEVRLTALDGVLRAEVTEVSVSGAQLAGTPVGITEKGIVGLGQPAALAPAIELLQVPLDELGVRVRTTPASADAGETEASATGGSLEIEVPLTVQGFPGSLTLRLATVTAALEAVEAPDGSAAAGSGSDGVGDGGASASESPAGSVSSPTSGAGTVGSTPAPTGTGGGTEIERIAVGVPAAAVDWDVRRLYAWMAVTGMVMLLAGPLAARASARLANRSDLRPFWRW